MIEDSYVPTVLDFTYEIINLHEENIHLRHELDHYKKMNEINIESISRSDKHRNELTGIIFKAILDPESTINRGTAAILKERISESARRQ